MTNFLVRLQCEVVLNALQGLNFRNLLGSLNGSVTLPTVRTVATILLDRIADKTSTMLGDLYVRGSDTTLPLDGWISPIKQKWVGYCRLNRCRRDGEITVEITSLEDVTLTGETVESVES